MSVKKNFCVFATLSIFVLLGSFYKTFGQQAIDSLKGSRGSIFPKYPLINAPAYRYINGKLHYLYNGNRSGVAGNRPSAATASVKPLEKTNTNHIASTITLSIATKGSTCGANGSMIVTASGGTPPYLYTYDYLGGFTYSQNIGNFERLQGGPYTITVTDATGQIVDTSVNLPNTYPVPNIDFPSSTQPSSCTGSDGIITLNASGGTPPYQYSIDFVNFQNSNVFPNLAQGTYSYFVRDANGCIAGYLDGYELNITREANCYNLISLPSFSIYSCNNHGEMNLLQPSFGTPPYGYSLDGVNFQTTLPVINNLGPGYHTVYVKDATGLTNLYTIYLIEGCPLGIEFIGVDASCAQSDGSLTANVINGIQPYTYSIDGVHYQAGNTFTGLAAGNYTVTVMDQNGDSVSDFATVYNRCPTITTTETDETCGQKNGSITATGNKGTTPYQFSIDGTNFQASNIFTGLASGNYKVILRDANGFRDSSTITVNNNCVQLSLSIVNTTCGNNNGSITAMASNGTAPYQYSIDGVNFISNNLFNNLAAGNYTITTRDANGLTKDSMVHIGNAPGPQATVSTTTASCTNTNGTITINATGGTSPLQFSIDNGNSYSTNNVFNSLDSGQYITVAKDANGCTYNDTVELTALPTPVVSIGNDTTLCNGSPLILYAPQQNGYSYEWQDNSNGYSYNVTSAGNYSVKVTNQYNCSATSSIKVSFKPLPAFTLGNDTSLCTGSVLLLQPALPPLDSYLWSTGSTSASSSISTTGTYWLKVSDGGCARSDSITVSFKPTPVLNLGNDTTLCDGQTLLLDAANNNSTYLWQDRSTQPTYSVSKAGIYSVKVDENGCDTSGKIMVGYLSQPLVYLTKGTTICISQQLILDATYPNSTYEWQDGSTLPQFTVSKEGVYSVKITNTCGSITESATVSYENCECKFYVPTAFTPNHDGKNDVFLPKYQCLFSDYELKVFNRYGQMVFLSRNAGNGWDGSFNTSLQPSGTYVWQLSYKDNLTGKNMRKNGTVVLVR